MINLIFYTAKRDTKCYILERELLCNIKNSVIPCLGIYPKKITWHSIRFQHCIGWMLCCRYKQPRYRSGFKRLSFTSCSHYVFATGPLELCSIMPSLWDPDWWSLHICKVASSWAERRGKWHITDQFSRASFHPAPITSHWLVQVTHKLLQEAEEYKAGAQEVSQKYLVNSAKDHLVCRDRHWSSVCDSSKQPTARERPLNHGAYSLKYLLSR